ncbi:unnamed protein product, partial [Rotaria magnacalcarata]
MADYLSRYPRQVEDDDDFIEEDFGVVPGIQHCGAVITRAQAKAQLTIPDTVIVESVADQSLVVDDQPPRVAGHVFDVTKIADAQKQDSFYQEQIHKLQQESLKCSFELKGDILYKIIKR